MFLEHLWVRSIRYDDFYVSSLSSCLDPSTQFQIATDVARRGTASLAGINAPKVEDPETTFSELMDCIHHYSLVPLIGHFS